MLAVLGVIAVVIIAIVVWGISTSNNLMTLREDVRMQQSQVETTLQRRSDLIPNLVNTVKGYATHEEEVFTEIADARSKLAGSIESGDIDSISESNNELDSALSRLLAITESYPDLKASEQFTSLQDELAGTENRINVARRVCQVNCVNFIKSLLMVISGNKILPLFFYFSMYCKNLSSNIPVNSF